MYIVISSSDNGKTWELCLLHTLDDLAKAKFLKANWEERYPNDIVKIMKLEDI